MSGGLSLPVSMSFPGEPTSDPASVTPSALGSSASPSFSSTPPSSSFPPHTSARPIPISSSPPNPTAPASTTSPSHFSVSASSISRTVRVGSSSASQSSSSSSILAETSTPTTSSLSQPTPAVQSEVSNLHRNRNIIIGCMVSIGLLLLFCLLGIWIKRRRNKRNRSPEIRVMSPLMQPHALWPKEHTATGWANSGREITATASSAPSVQALDGRSIAASSVRRQYLERELRAAQESLVDIDDLERHHHTLSRVPTPTSLSRLFSARGVFTRQNSQRVPRSELDAARQRNEELLSRIRDLEAQMESAWALGLSDGPPPGYSD